MPKDKAAMMRALRARRRKIGRKFTFTAEGLTQEERSTLVKCYQRIVNKRLKQET